MATRRTAMSGPSVRAVVFDVGGVIADQDRAAADAALPRLAPGLTAARVHQVRNQAELYDLWTDYSIGRLASIPYWSAVVEGLGLDATPQRAGALAEVVRATAWAVLDDQVLLTIRALRAGATVGLGVLSNSSAEYEDHISTFAGLFDVLHFSHRTGRRKPDPQAYLAVAADLGVAMSQAVFIDDKPHNVAAANRLGMTGLLYHDAAELQVALRRLGLLDHLRPLPAVPPRP